MARFDIHVMDAGYLLDVQTDLIVGFQTRLVAPLLPADSVPRPIKRLHPTFVVEGRSYVMATHLLTAVPATELRRPVGNLDAHYDEIAAAVGMIFNGF